MKNIAIALTLLLALAACSRKETAQSATAPARPAATAPAANAAAPTPASSVLTGTVRETYNAGGYTYLNIATSAGDQWAAVREMKIAKGDKVSVEAQMTMEDFESKTLKRTFPRIAFGTIAGEGAAPSAPAMPQQAAMPAGHPPAGKSIPPQMAAALRATAAEHMQAPAGGPTTVERAAGGKTVTELWAERGKLKGQEVVVRGKVVKFLGGIMGTNWMHLQDGTGSGEKGDNDITVTTNEKVSVGDVVTVKGTLAADKDFGAGYRYEVIIENARVQ